MDSSRRNLLKVLPLAVVTGASMAVDGRITEAVEIKSSKRYVFKLNADLSRTELDAMRQTLEERGFVGFVLISGDVDIFELDEL